MSHLHNNTILTANETRILERVGLTDASIQNDFRQISAKAGDVLFKPGDESRAFLILTKGQIRVELTTKADRNIVLYRMKEAQSCIITTTALLKSEAYFAKGVAQTDIEALALPQARFEDVMANNPRFTHFVLADYAQRVSTLVQLIDRLTSKDILVDLSALLLKHVNADGEVHLTQADIASNIGTAREVVSRKLSRLEALGVIRRERGRVIILDADALNKNTLH
jgi:CRP/FNR family transcriptional regulator